MSTLSNLPARYLWLVEHNQSTRNTIRNYYTLIVMLVYPYDSYKCSSAPLFALPQSHALHQYCLCFPDRLCGRFRGCFPHIYIYIYICLTIQTDSVLVRCHVFLITSRSRKVSVWQLRDDTSNILFAAVCSRSEVNILASHIITLWRRRYRV